MANQFEVNDTTRDLYIEMHRKYPNHRDKVDMLWGKVSASLNLVCPVRLPSHKFTCRRRRWRSTKEENTTI